MNILQRKSKSYEIWKAKLIRIMIALCSGANKYPPGGSRQYEGW
jgi:hypothetical protein